MQTEGRLSDLPTTLLMNFPTHLPPMTPPYSLAVCVSIRNDTGSTRPRPSLNFTACRQQAGAEIRCLRFLRSMRGAAGTERRLSITGKKGGRGGGGGMGAIT